VAETWLQSFVGYGEIDKGIVNQIRNAVKDLVDSFINAYLSVNPKGRK